MVETKAAIVVIGGGGHARVVAEAIIASGGQLVGHIAPEADRSGLLGQHLGGDEALAELRARGHVFALGVGFVDAAGAARRADLLARLSDISAILATVVHPSAIVSPSCQMEEGSFLAAGSVVGTQAKIGRGSIINSGAVVDHDSCLGENCHVATGARLAGGVNLGRNVLIGAGAVLRQGVSVGDGAIAGAGAVVVRAVEPGRVMVGCPAKEMQR